jgi:hypothetical protein
MLLLFVVLIPRAATHPAARALKQLFDFLFESLGCRRLCEARRYPAFSIDKEFREIPFDRPGSHNSLGFALEEAVKRMSPGAIDIDLAEHGKCHIIRARTKSRDFGGIARFLGTELIARKA